MSAGPRRALTVALVAVALAGVAAAVWRTAWLSDDAFITFRSVENLVRGNGPVWNAGERVQTFTHPLWFALVAGLRAVTGECPWSAQWLGLALAGGAAAWLLLDAAGTARGRTAALAATALLLGSHAWLDFATSGLETSLTYLLVAALIAARGSAAAEPRLRRTAVIAGLLAATRPDLVLLATPPVLACLFGVRRRAAVAALAVAALPVAAWSLFAAFYYGSPFPVTAFAKAFCHGVPPAELAAQGLRYLARSALADPLTIAVLALGLAAGLVRRGDRALAFGALVYVAYVVEVGGDYMLGRFLVPPLFVAIWLAARAIGAARPVFAIASTLAIALLGAIAPPSWTRPRPTALPRLDVPADGIVDEQQIGWWRYGLGSPAPEVPPWDLIGTLAAGSLEPIGGASRAVTIGAAVGAFGYVAGDRIHIVDPWLCDPYLMRLPLGEAGHWRIGHFFRRMPEGFLESIATGENLIADPAFARCYATLRSVVRDPLWSPDRLRNLWALWTGADRDALAAFAAGDYRTPPRRALPLAHFAGELAAGTQWFAAPPTRCVQAGGLAIRLPEARTAATLVLTATGDTDYTLTFRRGSTAVATARITQRTLPLDGMQPLAVPVPGDAGPFDELWIDVPARVDLPAVAAIGRIELRP